MSIEPIRRAIQEKASKAAELRRQADTLEAESRGMKEALAMLLASDPTPKPTSATSNNTRETKNERPAGKVGGRQPGAISNRWKRNLMDLYSLESFNADEVIQTVQRLEGRSMKAGDVKRLLDGYAEYGHVRIVGDGKWEVPTDAYQRFLGTLGEDDGEDAKTNEAADERSSAAPISQPLDPFAADRQAHPPKPGGEVEYDVMS